MSVAGCKAMGQCLESGSLSELRHIDLQRRSYLCFIYSCLWLDNLLFAGGIRFLGHSLQSLHSRNVQSIDCSRCHMANPGLKFLCQALSQSPFISLRYLRVYWNSINAGGIRHLAMTISLGTLDSLELLDLSSKTNASQMMTRKSNWRTRDGLACNKYCPRNSSLASSSISSTSL